VGCGVLIEHTGDRITGVRGDPDHPANFGRLCTKGASLALTATQQGRAMFPELRTQRSEPRRRVSWDAALDVAAATFGRIIREHGPDAVAFYISGQLLTEDYYVFNKLAKGLVGTNNVDTNSRLCMSSAVAGYKQTLGTDAPPACYEDIDHTDCLLIAGANPAYAHPILFRRIEDAKARNPALRIIVADPRRTDTAASADLHLAIVPGTDLVLLSAMLHVLLAEGMVDHAYVRDHTEGFDALRETIAAFSPGVASGICGVPAEDIMTAARWFGSARAALSMWCQGLNQSTHGTHNTAAIVHLHLATGQIGRPGAGPLSLTGQPNAMGGREVGGMANLLSAHRDLGNAEDRAWVANFWGVQDVPSRPGKTAVELFEAMHAGEIKAVWIACTNPAQSMPHLRRVREALARAEFVVVQDAFATTETARHADVLLPASTWGEKEGTMTNSERRIARVRRAVSAPGEARADWRIACDFARKLGPVLGKDAVRLLGYETPEDVFSEHAESTRGRDLDIAALSYAILERDGPQQWPYTGGSGRARLYADGVFATPSGRARFVRVDSGTVAEEVDAQRPLRMTSGRLRDQWHGMSRTGRVARLFNHVEEPALSMHPADMAVRSLADGDFVRVSGVRAQMIVRVQASAEVGRGLTFFPMHYGSRHLSHPGVNELTVPAFDPYSKQPELKHAAVQVEKVTLTERLLALRTAGSGEEAAEQALAWLDRLSPILGSFAYAYAGLIGRDRSVVSLQVAHDRPIPDAWMEEIDACLDLPAGSCLAYTDTRRRISKRALIVGGALMGVRLSGDVVAGNWLRAAMIEAQPVEALRRWVLGPFSAQPGGSGAAPRGRVICNCHDVAESVISTRLAQGASLATVQGELRCGTSCGSCLPELRRLASASLRAA